MSLSKRALTRILLPIINVREDTMMSTSWYPNGGRKCDLEVGRFRKVSVKIRIGISNFSFVHWLLRFGQDGSRSLCLYKKSKSGLEINRSSRYQYPEEEENLR
jgi:hypothetical protein